MMNMFMKKRIAAKKNRKKGFTLIEVIVVIVIIAILAAIAVPSLTRYIGTAGMRADMATAHNIQVILQAELSDQYVRGIALGGGDGQALTINGTTVADILLANGVELPTFTGILDPLSDIQITISTSRLNRFVYTTDRSITTYNGRTLSQVPK